VQRKASKTHQETHPRHATRSSKSTEFLLELEIIFAVIKVRFREFLIVVKVSSVAIGGEAWHKRHPRILTKQSCLMSSWPENG